LKRAIDLKFIHQGRIREAMATKKKGSRTISAGGSSSAGKKAATKVEPAKGKLGVMVVGLGAVATTMIAGVEAIRRGLAKPVGSLTQMGTIRLGKRTDNQSPLIKDFVPLADLDDVVFAGWDIFEDNVYEAATHAAVLKPEMLKQLKPYLEKIKPMPAVFDRYYVKRLNGTHVKKGKNKRDLADQVIADIRAFKKIVDRVVMIWCGSTEIFMEPATVHQSIAAFEKGLEKSDLAIAPSQIYAYAALKEGVPFANGAPNLTVDLPVMVELSKKNAAPICGKDFKTGQTFMKTVLAPAFKARMLGVNGWFSPTFWATATAKCWTSRSRSRPRKSRSSGRWNTSSSPKSIRPCTKTSTTRFASTTIRRAATRKRPGTTSTSSAGSAIPCS
jgi:myo-inositol-1-phosphate synthase